MTSDEQQAKDVVLRLLARREHSAQELKQKLRQRGFSDAVCDTVLTIAQANNWQSDERFAETWLRHSLANGDGLQKIKAAAQNKGLDTELVATLLQQLEPDWNDLCYQRLLKKFGHEPPSEPKMRDRMMRHLLQRGFSYSEIKQALSWQAEAATD
ncbi:OraA [Pseudidiomarina aestuarii]|uniref:Regulatory protein RecX n=1 Tax=Pseudidiomarina aestuarii TaxID=624146 RepID=A0A2T4CVE8_9GAMM|nr:OraA [Pseudidiomarina aestuarii]PTB86810.1 OraA [Pseudidiomarina aestuarii]PTB89307.1 OraA [Pseudidiomarina aestuarii]